jgi:hypothetical protein
LAGDAPSVVRHEPPFEPDKPLVVAAGREVANSEGRPGPR